MRLNNSPFVIISLLLVSILGACSDDSTPRPRGYYRIDFPEKEYQLLDSIFPYRFMYPTYGTIEKDPHQNAGDYWINVDFPDHNAKIHLSYYRVEDRFESLIEDSRNLAYKHTVKADAISERFYSNPERNVYGMLYQIRGNAASSWQFFVTDSSEHFLRGALYFAVTPNKDSLVPVADFFQKDLVVLLETVEWKESGE